MLGDNLWEKSAKRLKKKKHCCQPRTSCFFKKIITKNYRRIKILGYIVNLDAIDLHG